MLFSEYSIEDKHPKGFYKKQMDNNTNFVEQTNIPCLVFFETITESLWLISKILKKLILTILPGVFFYGGENFQYF